MLITILSLLIKFFMEEFIIDFTILSISFFFLVLFLQSSLDKAFNWKENLEWLKSHFSQTIFKSTVSTLLLTLMILEFTTGIIFGMNIIHYFFEIHQFVPFLSFFFSSCTLLCLFLGQRMAKDYEGAVSIAVYFGINLLGLFFIFLNLQF